MHHPFDVAVVGLGPVGALAGILLAKYGLRVVVLERESEPYSLPRAAHLDDEAFRILQNVGIPPESIGPRREIDGVDIQLARGPLLFRARKKHAPEQLQGYPAATLIHQPSLEKALHSELSMSETIDVRMGHEVLAIDQEDRVVRVSGKNALGPFTINASYVLGCDGANSAVREAMGSKLNGDLRGHQWLVVDVILKKAVDLPNRLIQYADPQRPTTYVPFPDPRRRWEFKLRAGETPNEVLQEENVRRLLAPHVDPDVVEIERAAVYTFRAAVADQWRNGRVLIAGDAAHLMPPFIGQGMCSGLRDVFNLAWKLALVAKGAAAESLLDTIEAERRPHVRAVTKLATRLGTLIQLGQPASSIRDGVFRLGHLIEPLNRALKNVEGEIPRTHLAFSSGTSASTSAIPQPFVEDSSGAKIRLDELLGFGFSLVGLGVSPREFVSSEDIPVWGKLASRSLHVLDQGESWLVNQTAEPVVRDQTGLLQSWAKQENVIVVVRPDRQVFGIFQPDEMGRAAAAIVEALQLT